MTLVYDSMVVRWLDYYPQGEPDNLIEFGSLIDSSEYTINLTTYGLCHNSHTSYSHTFRYESVNFDDFDYLARIHHCLINIYIITL